MVETKFKQTDVGLIPEDWEVYSINRDCSVKARIGWQGLTRAEFLTNGNYALITGTDIVDGKVKWSSCVYVNKERYFQDPNIIVKNYDVLISKDGTIGKVAIVQDLPIPAVLNSGIFVIRTKSDKVTQESLGFVFISPYFKDFIKRLTAGSTIVHLYQKDIVKFIFPLPSLEEQERIASALTSIDNLISSLDKQIAKTRHIKQGAMRQLLTFPDNVPLRPLGESLFFEQPTKYIVKSSDYYDAGLPVLTAGQSFILGYTKEKEGVFKAGEDNPVIIFDDFTTSFHWVDFNFKVKSSAMKMLRPSSNKVSFKYVYYAMSRITYEPVEHSRQWISVYSNFTIPVPSIEEQQRIASTLTAMDNQIAALEAKRRKYEMLKQGMMQQLLTGKIRLSQ